jgi:hypothetical protein
MRVLAPLFADRDVQSELGKQEPFVPEIRKRFLFSLFPDSNFFDHARPRAAFR